MELDIVLETLSHYVWPLAHASLWGILLVLGALGAVASPLPGRGPRGSARDPWRGFRFAVRERVVSRAGGRCEGHVFFGWGRCSADAVEVDHVYPWAKGGPTVVSNGQALCRDHNSRKGSVRPPWWYVLGLERRRRKYFPVGESVRVIATMTPEEQRLREEWRARRARAAQ